MLYKKRLLIALLSIWLSGPINAFEEQKILQKNHKAPFTGVLVPEPVYREIMLELEVHDLLKEKDRWEREQDPTYRKYTWGVGGFILGAMAFGLLTLSVK